MSNLVFLLGIVLIVITVALFKNRKQENLKSVSEKMGFSYKQNFWEGEPTLTYTIQGRKLEIELFSGWKSTRQRARIKTHLQIPLKQQIMIEQGYLLIYSADIIESKNSVTKRIELESDIKIALRAPMFSRVRLEKNFFVLTLSRSLWEARFTFDELFSFVKIAIKLVDVIETNLNENAPS